MPLLQLEGAQPTKGSVSKNCEPIIKEPDSPEHICTASLQRDIEDAFYEDPEDIPTVKLSLEDFKENLKNYVEENNMEIQDGDMSKALVAITAEAASIPMPKLKNVNRLRTEHQVYELPDAHPFLEGMDQRVPDDPCPYLLAIWTPGLKWQLELLQQCLPGSVNGGNSAELANPEDVDGFLVGGVASLKSEIELKEKSRKLKASASCIEDLETDPIADTNI